MVILLPKTFRVSLGQDGAINRHTVDCQRMRELNWSTLENAGALQASGPGLASMLSFTSCVIGNIASS